MHKNKILKYFYIFRFKLFKTSTKMSEGALKEKELGNAAYKKKDFDNAILHYSKVIFYFQKRSYSIIVVCLVVVKQKPYSIWHKTINFFASDIS